jgi:nucleotide-binding universal stress UspA family protein
MTLTQATDDLDLLLCGSRGLRRPLAAMLGSVSSHLVEHARCPVLVVPPAASRSRQTRLGLAAAGSTS